MSLTGLIAEKIISTCAARRLINNKSVNLSELSCRLTPLFAFVIFYTASVYAHTGSGPLWKAVVYPEVLDCRKNWWASLIYLGNYINVDEMVPILN